MTAFAPGLNLNVRLQSNPYSCRTKIVHGVGQSGCAAARTGTTLLAEYSVKNWGVTFPSMPPSRRSASLSLPNQPIGPIVGDKLLINLQLQLYLHNTPLTEFIISGTIRVNSKITLFIQLFSYYYFYLTEPTLHMLVCMAY